jgi:hypothetical protein
VLFDLQSGRRRVVVRIVYGTLAGLMLIGFVFFGIGSDVSFDCAGAFEGDDGPTATQFQSQIDDAEKKLAKDPKDEDALTDIARYRYLAGNSLVEPSDDGTTLGTVNEDVRSEWSKALDAWEKYLKTEPKQPDPLIAGQMLCAYDPTACGYGGADTELIDYDGAAAVVEVLAEDDPRPEYFGQVAYYRYADGDLEGGKEAAAQALAEASGKDREQLQKQLDALEQEATKLVEEQRKSAQNGGEGGLGTPGGSPLSSPFGSGLGSGATTPPGAVPPG